MLDANQYEYNFEIETILQQFIAIIDNAMVMRYSVNKDSNERILDEVVKPGYILGTKQRVMLDIINKAKNYQLPVVIINLNGISFAKERQAAKFRDIHVSTANLETAYKRPTPISIKVEVTILTKYMTDLYQIYGKLATQFQPTYTYSWFVPQTLDANWSELINKIEWDGELNLDIRTESKSSDEDKFSGKMSFTIDGWIFPTMNKCANVIYDIGTTVVLPEDVMGRIYDDISIFRPLVYSVVNNNVWKKYNNPREIATSHPQITSIYNIKNIHGKSAKYVLDSDRAERLIVNKNTKLLINGYNLQNVKALAKPWTMYDKINEKEAMSVSKTYESDINPLPDTLEKKDNKISGYLLNITKQSENQAIIDFEKLLPISGQFDIYIFNDIDYDSLSARKGFILKS